MLRLLQEPDLPVGALFLEMALGQPSAGQRLTKFLGSPELRERISATHAIDMFGAPQHADAVWKNSAIRDARYYLDDLRLRQQSLRTLINLELNRSGGVRVQPLW